MLEEMQARKNELKDQSEKCKNKRNELNIEASRLATERNELNIKTKDAVEEAQKLKEQRDEYNKQVSENKKKRDPFNEAANKVYAKIDKIRKDLNLADGSSLKEMSREVDRLEFKQQTEVMSSAKEREPVDNISSLRDEFKKKKDELEGNEELKSLFAEAQELRDNALIYHDKVKEYADLAQQYHDKMIGFFKQADSVRADSDVLHKQFIGVQDAADEQHRMFIRAQKEIRDFNKIILGIKRKKKEDYTTVGREAAKKEAEDIYDKFKRGEKLDTDALMALQRSKLV